jgi:hypothetical protein
MVSKFGNQKETTKVEEAHKKAENSDLKFG